jgi:uncharacterized protein
VAVETKVKTPLFIDPQSQVPIIVLETVSDERSLPIWINVAQVRAIALELENVSLPRPSTHDLIGNLLGAMGRHASARYHYRTAQQHLFRPALVPC